MKQCIFDNAHASGGFAALASVVIIGAMLILISVGTAVRGTGDLRAASGRQAKLEAAVLADHCAEAALLKLVSVLLYNGGETIEKNGGTCEILPIEGTGNTSRTVKTFGTARGYTHKTKIEIMEVSPELVVSSWRSVADF